jgi:hypothetical protein
MAEPLVTGTCAAYAAVTVGLATLCLGLFACVAAMWRRYAIGHALLNECNGETAFAWAEIGAIRVRNAADDRRMREAMVEAFTTRGER